LDWPGLLAFLAARGVAGVERVANGRYQRTIACLDETGVIEIAFDPGRNTVTVVTRGLSRHAAAAARDRVRYMLDLETDLRPVAEHLTRDPTLAALLSGRALPRVFRGWDGFEVATRAVLGQQVSVEHARQLNGRLVERGGSHVQTGIDGLDRLFPTASAVLRADLSSMGAPGARVAALRAVAEAAAADPRLFARGASIDDTVTRLRAIRGIGDWTAHYIAMRGCGEPDAFPASDVGLLRGAADGDGTRPSPAALLARAAAWRPWRAYAAHLLWAHDAARR